MQPLKNFVIVLGKEHFLRLLENFTIKLSKQLNKKYNAVKLEKLQLPLV